jgi:hypothetical protein
MATIKSHTDLDQSRELAKILPLESADMYIDSTNPYYIHTELIHIERFDSEHDPCWSLAALLDILPKGTDIIKEEADTENEEYMCTVGVKYNIISTFGNNPIDACYDMIIKLHEMNLL